MDTQDHEAEAARETEAVKIAISNRLMWTFVVLGTLVLIVALAVAEWRQRQYDHDEAIREAALATVAKPESNHREPTPITRAPRQRVAATVEPDPEPEEPVDDVEEVEEGGEE